MGAKVNFDVRVSIEQDSIKKTIITDRDSSLQAVVRHTAEGELVHVKIFGVLKRGNFIEMKGKEGLKIAKRLASLLDQVLRCAANEMAARSPHLNKPELGDKK